MSMSFLATALLIISALTNLTVEGVKKLLDEFKVKYSTNVLAAICSMVLAGVVSVFYLIMNDITLTVKTGLEVVMLMYLGFLVSTVGYDKVIQTFVQIKKK